MKNRYYGVCPRLDHYANSQPLAQDILNTPSDPNDCNRYYYLHDRLGSVRMMIDPNVCIVDPNGSVVNTYMYKPFGEDFDTEIDEQVYNPFKFTGQWYDAEIAQYYLRARQYDPALMRLTSRDSHNGKPTRPLTFHRYLYCMNEPVQHVDLDGRFTGYANMLMSTGLGVPLRKADYKFHKSIQGKTNKILNAASMANLQRGAVYDIMVAQVDDGSFTKSVRDVGIEVLGHYSENLGRIASFGADVWDDKDAIRDILKNESWKGLLDYSTEKLLDQYANPDNFF